MNVTHVAHILGRALLVLWGFAAAGLACDTTAAATPNVLVFYVDDMGWGQPGCYGGTLAPTPNIDAIAASGVRFTDGYSSGCICSPGRVGLMTGRYQARTGHDGNATRPGHELLLSETTIAQRMQAAGYTTGMFGKWHLGATSTEYLPVSRGFDVSLGTIGNLGEGDARAFFRNAELLEEMPGAPVTSPVYAREAVEFLSKQAGKPWFLYVSFNAVHTPHVASPEWLAKFDHLDRRVQNYAANIAEADAAIGTVMAGLRSQGLEDNTLVFVIGDNGGASGEAEFGGLRGRKWFVWEGGVRVPFIAAWKQHIPAGRVLTDPVIQLDLFPTALAAAGVPSDAAPNLDGVNLLPLLTGETAKLADRPLFFRFGVQYAVRAQNWKLVKASLEMEPMLVNLALDPGESQDLSASEPARKQELQAIFDAWNANNAAPRWEDRRWNGEEDRQRKRRTERGKK